MDLEQRGVAAPRLPADRRHHPAVDGEAGALEPEALRSGERDLRLPLAVEIRQLALARSVGPTDEDLGRRQVVGRGERDERAVAGGGEGGHLAGAADPALRRRAAGRPDRVERDVARVLHLEEEHVRWPQSHCGPTAPIIGSQFRSRAAVRHSRRAAGDRDRPHAVVPGDVARMGMPEVGDRPAIGRERRPGRGAGRRRQPARLPALGRHDPDVGRAVLVTIRVARGRERHPPAVRRPGGVLIDRRTRP